VNVMGIFATVNCRLFRLGSVPGSVCLVDVLSLSSSSLLSLLLMWYTKCVHNVVL